MCVERLFYPWRAIGRYARDALFGGGWATVGALFAASQGMSHLASVCNSQVSVLLIATAVEVSLPYTTV